MGRRPVRAVAGDRAEYLIERGARAAERMMNQGAYRDFLAAASRWGERAGQAMAAAALPAARPLAN